MHDYVLVLHDHGSSHVAGLLQNEVILPDSLKMLTLKVLVATIDALGHFETG